MAQIPTYNDSITAQGGINSQASPNAFGAQLGTAMQNVGEALNQYAVQEDLSKVYTDMSGLRTEFTKQLRDAEKDPSAAKTLVPKMLEEMQSQFDKQSVAYTTRAGRREFARLSSEMKSSFLIRAIDRQSALAAELATNNHNKQVLNLGQAAFLDPTQVDDSIAQLNSAIDNPEGDYKGLTEPERERLRVEGAQSIRMSGIMSQVQNNPEQFLAKVSPDMLQKFRMTARVSGALDSTKPTTNARVDALAPTIQQNAEKYGVDSNIMAAQVMQESGGRTNVVSSAGAKGVSQFMDETAKRYNVNVNDDASSIRGQANYMSDLLKQFGGDYRKALAGYNWGEGNVQKAIDKWGTNWLEHAPKETRNYVADILANAGVAASTGEPIIAAGGKPISLGDKNFDALPWDKQYQVLQAAQTQVNANQVRDQQKIAFAEQQRKVAQEAELNILLPKLEGNELTPQEVLDSKSLDFQHKNYMLNAIRVRAAKMDDTQPKVFNEVLDKVIKGEITDPDTIWDYVGKGVSFNDVRRLQDVAKGKGGPLGEARNNFLKMAKSQITSTTLGVTDPEGDKQYYNFTQEFQQTVKDKAKNGVALSELLDPNSREYLGSLVTKYKRSPQDRMKATADMVRQSASAAQPSKMPRQPNETPDQYLARVNGGK